MGARGWSRHCGVSPPTPQNPELWGHSLSSLAFTRYSSCSFVSDLLSERSCVCLSRDCGGGTSRDQALAGMPGAPPVPSLPPTPPQLTSSTSFTPSGGTFFLLPWLPEKQE